MTTTDGLTTPTVKCETMRVVEPAYEVSAYAGSAPEWDLRAVDVPSVGIDPGFGNFNLLFLGNLLIACTTNKNKNKNMCRLVYISAWVTGKYV